MAKERRAFITAFMKMSTPVAEAVLNSELDSRVPLAHSFRQVGNQSRVTFETAKADVDVVLYDRNAIPGVERHGKSQWVVATATFVPKQRVEGEVYPARDESASVTYDVAALRRLYDAESNKAWRFPEPGNPESRWSQRQIGTLVKELHRVKALEGLLNSDMLSALRDRGIINVLDLITADPDVLEECGVPTGDVGDELRTGGMRLEMVISDEMVHRVQTEVERRITNARKREAKKIDVTDALETPEAHVEENPVPENWTSDDEAKGSLEDLSRYFEGFRS